MTEQAMDAREHIEVLGKVQDALVREVARLKQKTLEQEAQLWGGQQRQPVRKRRLWWPVRVQVVWPDGRLPWTWWSRHGSQRPYGLVQYLRFGLLGVRLGHQQDLEDWHADRTRHFQTMWKAAPGRAHEHALRELARVEQRARAVDLP